MNRSIVAIPLFAAIWLGAPASASAQDPEPAPAAAPPPRSAVPRPVEERTRAAEPRAAETVTTASAEADDQRGRNGGGRDGRDNGRAHGRDNGRNTGRGNGRDNGRNNGRDIGRDNRGGPRIAIARPPNVPIYSGNYGRPRYYPPAYYHNWARRNYRWSPLPYAPWSLIYGSVGFTNYGYSSYGNYGAYGSYGYGPYGYGGWGPFGRSTTFDTGSVRLRIRPRDAQVFVDGYFAGYVDDFDGNFQSLRLEQGGHKIEIRMPGFETLQLDVHVQPNRTITLREDLIPRP